MKRSRPAAGRRAGLAALGLVLALAVPARFACGDSGEASASILAAAGWEESAPGWGSSLPDRKATVGGDGSLRGDFLLAPGTSLAWEKDGAWRSATVSAELFSEGTNASSEDYSRGNAHFPVAVTAVFGKDSLDLPFRRRVLDFFSNLRHGFPPGGIRLTYAWGNDAPTGSMFRPVDEETVFVLAGEDERGKRIAATRELVADFRAAYGRDPKGPVTKFIVRAGRPSGEKGAVKAGVLLALPAH